MAWLALVVITVGVITHQVHGASLNKLKIASEDDDGRPASGPKALNVISFPKVPEFPKINSRPGQSSGSGVNKPVQQTQQSSVQVPAQIFAYSAPAPQQAQARPKPEAVVPIPAPVVASTEEASGSSLVTEGVSETVEVIQAQVGIDVDRDTQQLASVNAEESQTVEIGEVGPRPGKAQTEAGALGMPPQVMHILNALGTGGSLVQASKPEKDGVGHVTSNAIGYASGQDSKVDALVGNSMTVNKDSVTITDTAHASASSANEGAAFAQATLSSNGWANWGGGSGGWVREQ